MAKKILAPSDKSKTVKQATPPPRDAKTLPVALRVGDTIAQAKARTATKASVNAVIVVDAFQNNLLGKDLDVGELAADMEAKFTAVNNGDLSDLENMLVGQATALQTMFTHLAKRASTQGYFQQFQTYMTLALKAQAQSRATISALADLKYPRQTATFVKQANIAGGHQQVVNGNAPASDNTGIHMQSESHAKNLQSEQSKLLEASHGQRLDIGAAQAASRVNQAVETVG